MPDENAIRPSESDGGHLRREVQSILDRMARAMTTGDGRAMAELWDTPALVIGDKHVMPFTSADEIERFFGGAKEHYNARGIIDTRAEIDALHWPTDRVAMVQVRWPYLDTEGTIRGEESSTYTLRRDDHGNWRLLVAVMQGIRSS